MQHEIFTCSICYCPYDEEERLPRIIPICGHTFCSTCLVKLYEGDHPVKCPLDKKTYLLKRRRIESFPINYSLKQGIQETSNLNLCRQHNEALTLFCLQDKKRVCSCCVHCGEHQGHETKHIVELKSKAEEKIKKLEVSLHRFDLVNSNLEKLFQGKKDLLLGMVEDEFIKIMEALFLKKIEMGSEITKALSCEKEKITEGMKEVFHAKNILEAQITSLKRIDNEENFLKSLDEDCPVLNFNLDLESVERRLVPTERSLKDRVEVLNKDIVAKLNSFSVKLFESERQAPKENYNDYLTYKICNDGACISSKESSGELPEGADQRQMTNEIKNMENIVLTLNQSKVEKGTIHAFTKLWKELAKPKSLDVNFYNFIDQSLQDFCQPTLWMTKSLSTLKLNLSDCKVSDESVTLLFSNVLPKFIGLREICLNLEGTRITDKSLSAFGQSSLSCLFSLESLELFLALTNITDVGMARVFQTMKPLKKLLFDLSFTQVTDRSMETFNRCTLPKLKKLETLQVYLRNTEISNFNIPNMLLNMANLKQFILDLNSTKVTNESISQSSAPALINLEKFELDLGNTMISDSGISQLFQCMKAMNTLNLNLKATEISESTVNLLAIQILPSIQSLENLNLCLSSTKITDESLNLLCAKFQNLKKISLDFSYTVISDQSIRTSLINNLIQMKSLEEFKVDLDFTLVSEETKNMLEILKEKQVLELFDF